MINSKLLCLYYPTTIVLIDDDVRFLENMSLNLSHDLFYRTFQDPKAALAALKETENQNKFLSHTVAAREEEAGKFSVDFNTSVIYKEVYNRKQFDEVSVIVVDYSMPQMNGEELLKNLTQSPAKKLMLTGQADEATAVRLFNDGIIDKFMLKSTDSHTLIQHLNQNIEELQTKYFHGLSDIILKPLSGQIGICFTDPIFVDFFNKTLADTSTSSYYLIEISGSFLLLDADASPTWLLVKTKNELQEFAPQAEAEGASEDVVDSIKNGHKIPYFNDFDEYVDATSGNWDKYLYAAQELNGKAQYRYAITKNIPGFRLHRDKILSFNTYLHNNFKKS
jgi:CheY-like chemotaxis protein